jgi:translation initiation factor IF-2
MKKEERQTRERPPIVAVVGHIDHGKSTLLDYIRRSNTVASEAGGITQHLSAYEVDHNSKRITFLDTPGHEAFRAMRSRGLEVADVAVLVVSAEDGVKPQTMEAVKLILEANIPYIVALTKIDKPGADVEKAKHSLLENGIYLEGLGGDIPFVAVSGKTGEGVPELLDLIVLAGEMTGLSTDPDAPGAGLIIEAHVDNKRGNTATLMIQSGAVESGEYIVAGNAIAPVRIMENFLGKTIKEAGAGSPVRVVGFSTLPAIGTAWRAVETKKEAESDSHSNTSQSESKTWPAGPERSSGEIVALGEPDALKITLPIVIKTDFAGTGEAILHEIEKLPKSEKLEVRVVSRGVGPITESDVRFVGAGKNPGIILGFNVKIDAPAKDLAERLGVETPVFDIIYKLAEWLGTELEKRRPRAHMEERTGNAKILKVFSVVKNQVVLGGRVEEGAIAQGEEIKIMRRDVELGRGTIVSLQSQKTATKKVEAGSEFGAMVKVSCEPAAGDTLEAFAVVVK